MAPAYSVSSATKLPRDGQGLLVAAVDALNSNSITATIIGSVPVAEGSSFDDAAAAVSALLPKGLHVVGSYSLTTTTSAPWKPPSSSSGGCPAITASTAGSGAGVAWLVNGQAGGVADSSAAAPAAADADASLDVAAGFVPVRAHADVTLQVLFTPTSSSTANGSSKQPKQQQQPVPPAAAIQSAVKQLSQQLFANPQQLVFVPEDSVDASSSNNNNNSGSKQQQASKPPVIITANSSVSVAEALACSSGGDPCISYRLLQQTSSSAGNRPPPAPMFEFTPAAGGSSGAQQQVLSLPLSLDVLCYVPTSTSSSSSSATASTLQASLLVPALQQQLSQIETQLLQQAAAGRGPLHPVKALHFKPPVLGFPLTVCYAVAPGPQEAAEAALLPRRQELHQLLGLPSNVPMLRLANALAWGAAAAAAAGPEAAVKGVRLRNVHEGLAPPGFGGQVYLVDGLYDYYHYMQDKFNDAGWGCAYRSLQTIVSWYKLQHYTSKPVPSHRQIQELLVSINARDATLLGSNQWIGAVEVGWFLDEYLGASHKMIIVNQGADIPQHARALAQHFVTQRTPVSIGGGVLAYTLLGVAFNEDTGEAAFLILDPHYTGGEDLKKVVSGSWVAWKQLGDNAAAGGPLFVKDAFYNFCCPQRPTTV